MNDQKENSQNAEPSKTMQQGPVAGLLAEFSGPQPLIAAAEQVRTAGYKRFDAFTPYPLHKLDRAMRIRPTILPWLVLGAGITGAGVAILLQWWTNAVDYPHIISGKPFFSLPANIPIAFELLVLFSALTAFAGALLLSGLPEFVPSLFGNRRIRKVTTDGFYLAIEASDAQFDETRVRELLKSLGATEVETYHEPPASARAVPVWIYWMGGVAVSVALIPPLIIANFRAKPSEVPRVHPVGDMDFQPKYKPQNASSLFADGRAMRPPVPGTVALGELRLDDHLYRGRVGDEWATTFPVPVTDELMERGQQRYDIYCATCHGLTGEGDGITHKRAIEIVSRDWVPPLSIHSKLVRGRPVGQIFNSITNGIRTMPAYAAQIPVEDRWAIVLYIRALQRSQNATIKDVPESMKGRVR